MANIYVEGKGPQGVQFKESLKPTAVTGYNRGLCVVKGADAYTVSLVTVAALAIIGILEEDAISVKNPSAVGEFGQTVAQIGANISAYQPLTPDANARLVPALPGQQVAAIALEDQTYVAANAQGNTSFATVFVLGLAGYKLAGVAPAHVTVAGAIPVSSGVYGLGSAGALAMTLATPTAAQDGTLINVVAETAQAHTVTTAANKINGNKLTVTFSAVGQSVELLAMGGIWIARTLTGAVLS
jgi:hypothetical protein